jgi:hypothetical protein
MTSADRCAHAGLRIADGEVRVATRAFLGYVGDDDARPSTRPSAQREFATGDLGRSSTQMAICICRDAGRTC